MSSAPALVSGYLDPVYTDARWDQDWVFMAEATGDTVDTAWTGCTASLALVPTATARRDVDSFELTSGAGEITIWASEGRVGVRGADCSAFAAGEYGWELRRIDGDGIATAVAVGLVQIVAGLSDPPLTGSLVRPGAAKGTITVRPAPVATVATAVGPKGERGDPGLQAQRVDATFQAEAGWTYLLDATGGGFTATLPAAPAEGDTIIFRDATGDCETDPVSIDPGDGTINGVATPFSFNVGGGAAVFSFTSGDWTWWRA